MWEPLNDAFDADEAYEEYLKQQWEDGRMTEIRIVDGGSICHFAGCMENGYSWQTSCGEVVLIACENHSEPLRHACNIQGMLTITGGYDDEPKSKLVAQREVLEEHTDFSGKHALKVILDHLIEKERADGN